jgi:hypothetical protein
VHQIPLLTGGRIGIVDARMADRTLSQYGGPNRGGVVNPDEQIADPTAAYARAVAWLRER